MSFEQPGYVQNEAPVQQETAEKDICRDFKKGDCRRGERCIYHHPKLDACRDFQSRECTRQGCRFAHVTRQEEETYTNSGILPAHMSNGQIVRGSAMNGGGGGGGGGGFGHNGILGKRGFSVMSGASPMPMPFGQQDRSSFGQQESPSDLCRDFEKGDCRRGTRCKFYHPRLIICRDFQKEKCERDNCRFLHMTKEEETTYEGNGIVPDHIDKEKLKKNQVMTPSNDGAAGMGEMYGKRTQANFQTGFSNNYQTGFSDNYQSGFSNSNASLEAALQENQGLKSKLTEMQQQILDLRKMNDTLYEQNNNYRTSHNGYNN